MNGKTVHFLQKSTPLELAHFTHADVFHFIFFLFCSVLLLHVWCVSNTNFTTAPITKYCSREISSPATATNEKVLCLKLVDVLDNMLNDINNKVGKTWVYLNICMYTPSKKAMIDFYLDRWACLPEASRSSCACMLFSVCVCSIYVCFRIGFPSPSVYLSI